MGAVVVDDPLLDFFEKQQAAWAAEIDLISRGHKTTSELRDGKIVDTTQETLADLIRLSDELRDAKARHEARQSQAARGMR